jgi:TnpA family transposase
MCSHNKRLTILSAEEKFALYELPDFNESQQQQYLIFTNDEQQLIFARSNLSAQLYCALQIGYFKAKQMFFDLDKVPQEDIDFLMKCYFPTQQFFLKPITKYEYYQQVKQISNLFGYRLWSKNFMLELYDYVLKISKRDINIGFILAELIQFLSNQKIIRPGYTILQDIISKAINSESKRLGNIIISSLDDTTRQTLEQLLVMDDVISYLAVLKQDSKDFGYKIMTIERKKLEKIKPLYNFIKNLIPTLDTSKQNLLYYADLINYYTIYDLRRLKISHSYLYLLCYAWQRYLQLTDNLINAFCYHLKQFDDGTKNTAEDALKNHARHQERQSIAIGRLLQLYVDESVSNDTTFGEIREKYAFSFMPKDKLRDTAKQMIEKPITELNLKWKAVDTIGHKFKKHLRPIFMTLDFASASANDAWLLAIQELKQDFLKQKNLKNIANEYYIATIPKRLNQHLIITNSEGNITGIQANRYEFWLYRQIKKRLDSGELYIDDSINHRFFEDELVPLIDDEIIRQQFNLPCLLKPITEQLDELYDELKTQWALFEEMLKRKKSEHIQYEVKSKTLSFHKLKVEQEEELQDSFYEKLSMVDNTDVLRFVNEQCDFLSAFSPLQSHYIKQKAEDDILLAVIISQAMNHGRLKLSKISDIPYHTLSYAYQQYFRKNTLEEANDIISNAISQLPIFTHYSFDLSNLYGGVDGQKYTVEHPTTKARYSKKYFGKGKGVVAYTLLVNHIPLQVELIGAHEHESYYVFDIFYNNTTDIVPTAITGDMHSINKANFIILHWFESDFRPRFTALETQVKHLYCGDEIENYEEYLIKPISQIDRNLIIEEWQPKIKQIILTLANKETTQSKIIKKLCTYKQRRTLKAIFELDKLKRSIYTLKYLTDYKLQQNVHRSQNRIESYHQLRAAISQVNGKKQLSGKTDLDVEIANQCGRLVANAIIYLIFRPYTILSNE